jgi:type IV pilus assembly protein PilQ
VPSHFSKTNEPTVSIDLIDLKDADIQSVLRILSIKGNVNIVAASDVTGNITVKLTNVSWQKALDVILKTYDYGYERDGNIITVTGMDRLTTQKEAEQKLYNIQPVITEVFTLKYLDADDMKETLQPQLSPRGTITVLKSTMTPGWEFTSSAKGESLKKVAREQQASTARSKTLIISDIPAFIEKIKKVIAMLDSPPQQILIEARIIEVNEDVLRDIGFEWGTGSSGAESTTITSTPAIKSSSGATVSAVGGHLLNTQVTPSAFDPESTGLTATNTGMKFLYQKLMGSQFEAVMHALQENANANTLSAPRILTLNNQEATILVGTKYPILTSEVSSESGTTVTSTLDYYQDIGIQLNVVPQISGDKYINMVIHPAVTAYDTSNTVGTNAYPVISTREAQTRVLLEDNQTIVIGGLLKDVKKKTNMGIPFLKDIPILGNLFGRDTNDTEKVDLLIFITATIIKPTDMYRSATPDERMTSYQIEQQMIRERLKRNQLTGVEIKR